MDKCIFWRCEYSTVWPPSDALIITSRYLPPHQTHKRVQSIPISKPRVLKLTLVVYFLCSHKHRKRNLFSQASQLESCTLVRTRRDIVLSAGETLESMSPCRNLLLLVFDCTLAMLFCLPCFFACQCCCWRNMPSVSFLDIILCTCLYYTCILMS